jgi:CAAX protease family protein
MSTPPRAPSPHEETGLIAPSWHTATVIVFLLGIAGLSAWRGSLSPVGNVSGHARLANYAVVFVWEWLTVAFIAWGVRRRNFSLSSMISGSWPRAAAFFRDLGISILFLIGSNLVLGIIQFALKSRPNQAVRNLLPETPAEMVAWIFLAATAGFCEETIFRGYLQQQLGRMTRNATVGLVLQAVVFGICHGYQGIKQMITISVYGALFGLLAVRMRTLRPGMLAHFIQDSAGGLTLRWAFKKMGGG